MSDRSHQLVEVSCGLCGADDPQPLGWLEDTRYGTLPHPVQLVACRVCGFRYLTPQPQPGSEALFYPAGYDPYRRTGWTAAARRLLLRREVRLLWPYLAPPRRVLEIGCATGELLLIIRAAGNPFVSGIEPDPAAAQIALRHGLDVQVGTLETLPLPSAAYDTVLLQHVLEHLPEPGRALARVAALLRPGGSLVLWLPNGDSWAARCFGSAWMGYDPPRHRSVFTPATLRRACAQVGLEIVAVHHEWHGLEWAWGLRLLARAKGWRRTEHVLARLHFAAIVATTPIAIAAALARRSGRLRVLARKRVPGS